MTHLLLPDIEGGKMSGIDEGWKIDKDGRAQKNWELGVSTWLILILPDIPKGGFSFFPLQRL